MESNRTIRVAAALVMCSGVWAAEQRPLEQTPAVDICMPAGPGSLVATKARIVASQVFLQAGVKLQWRGTRSCPEAAVRVVVLDGTPANLLPGALAYALPYEGTRVVVFYDRIRQAVEPAKVGCLMGHVLAHEIGHVIEGVNRHSTTGVMKANYTSDDYSWMGVKSLPFTEEDVRLIHAGLANRKVRLMAAR